MSPYPAQVNREAIVDRARDIIETEGLERLTLQHLATALGIQAPSLYRHVGSKNELLRAVNEVTVQRMVATVLADANTQSSPPERVMHMANSFRRFVHAFPTTYSLAFSAGPEEIRPAPEMLEAMALPIQAILAGLTGEAASQTALRSLQALLHGFVTLELSGQFTRGGDLNTDFEQSVAVFVRGWQQAGERGDG